MSNFKYFSIDNSSTVDDIKKQYKKLAFRYHPDLGGSNEEMKAVILEYEAALKQIGKIHNKNYTFDQEYVDLINALIKLNMKNVTIEICGWFVYVTGDTKPFRKQLGKDGIGLIWNPKKTCWYYKPAWYYKKNKNTWSMNKIRETWGSQIIEKEKQRERILVTA